MSLKKGTIVTLTLIFVLSLLLGCAGPAPTSKLEPQEWQLSTTYTSTRPSMWIPLQYFVEEMNKRTNGLITVKVHPASALCPPSEEPFALGQGAFELSYTILDYVVGKMPFLGYVGIFQFRSYDSTRQLIEKNAKEAIKILDEEIFAQHGIKMIGFGLGASEYIIISPKQIKSLKELDGLKVRSAGGYFGKCVATTGAVPTSVPWAETYIALQRGVIDAAFSPPTTVRDQKFYEAAPYTLAFPGGNKALSASLSLLINRDLFNSLPTDIQKTVLEVAHDTQIRLTEEMEKEGDKAIALLKEKSTYSEISTEEMNEWKASLGPIWDEYIAANGDPARKIVDLVKG